MSLLLRIAMVASCLTSAVHAQDVVNLNEGSLGAYFAIKQLRTTGSVLHVVAHPDDEDGALLAYCARGLGVRTMLFSITRGEGGANLISNHFFDELGVLRSLEHQKAAEYYGNELFYSRAADYGYSKTLLEARSQWQDGLPILADLVEVIRREQPTILVSRFRGDARDGHGHHQMAGVLSRIAFDAAADPQQFPEQLEAGLAVWQPKKLFIGQRSRSADSEPRSNLVSVPTGSYDPLIGRSYAQVARFGLGFQRSQGISGHQGETGPRFSRYLLARTDKSVESSDEVDLTSSLFSGLDVRLANLTDGDHAGTPPEVHRSLQEVDEAIDLLWENWNARRPHRSVPALAVQLLKVREVARLVRDEPASTNTRRLRLGLQRAESLLQKAIVECAGLELEAWATDARGSELSHATPDARLRVFVWLANQNPELTAEAVQVTLSPKPDETSFKTQALEPESVIESQFGVTLGDVAVTRPYWQRDSPRQPMYQVQPGSGQRPAPIPPLRSVATLVIAGVEVQITSPVETRLRDPKLGRVSYPLTVAPKLSVAFPLRESVMPASRKVYRVPVVVRSSSNEAVRGQLQLELPEDWSSEPKLAGFELRREGEEVQVEFKVRPNAQARGEYSLSAIATVHGQSYREGFQTVTARDLGRMNVFRPAVHQVRIADIQLSGAPKVGYIAGSGDDVAESLAPLGVRPKLLTPADVAAADLSDFDVILVGVRAYAVRADVRTHNARLLDFVKRGGVLIVQYQTPEFDANFGPYPYEMGRRPEEVSEEDAKVTILQPDHVLFQKPNLISPGDFDGWVEQRGSKFWASWDEAYQPLLECHDTDQPEQRGGMLFARYGEGVYIYSAYAWYRQLPSGVPGAYRLFANLLSLPETLR